MGITTMFKNYNNGNKIVLKLLNKKKIVFDNKNLIKYGEKILNMIYFKIKKLI
jgi:hypothetical protein